MHWHALACTCERSRIAAKGVAPREFEAESHPGLRPLEFTLPVAVLRQLYAVLLAALMDGIFCSL